LDVGRASVQRRHSFNGRIGGVHPAQADIEAVRAGLAELVYCWVNRSVI
jgi:hypothetical protein